MRWTPAGTPYSRVPGVLRELVARGMGQVEAVLEEGARLGVHISGGSPVNPDTLVTLLPSLEAVTP